jgi:hypothetical protein
VRRILRQPERNLSTLKELISTMSKITDYSKFDHIDIDEEDEHEIDPPPSSASAHVVGGVTSEPINPSSSTASASAEPPQHGTTKKHPSIPDRYIFSYSNQKIYEWEQSLEEVSIYIDLPPPLLNVESPASYIAVNIQATHLQVGLKGNDRFFIDEDTFDKVKVKESSWYLDEGVITIVLAKCFRGQTWEGVLCGHRAAKSGGGQHGAQDGRTVGIQESIDPFTKQEMQRTLMLERFQEENPGFDFRDATFNGEVPNPRTFMGGVGYGH